MRAFDDAFEGPSEAIQMPLRVRQSEGVAFWMFVIPSD